MQTNLASLQLSLITDKYPDVIRLIDLQRQARSTQRWVSWCFLPTKQWQEVFTLAPSLSCKHSVVLTWAYTKGIYSFTPELTSALSLNGAEHIPLEVFFRLPEWAIYIETPDLSSMFGFFASLRYDSQTRQASLQLLIQADQPVYSSILIDSGTIQQAIDSTPCPHLSDCLSRLLYLCSNDIDITPINGRLPERAKPKSTKFGWRLFPANNSSLWVVGARFKNDSFKVQEGQWIGQYERKALNSPVRYQYHLSVSEKSQS